MDAVAVERGLDDELGAHVDDVLVAAGLAREELARLEGEELVGEALEGRAEQRELVGPARVARRVALGVD